MQTVLLDKSKHDRNRFNCGIDALNNYLKVMASQQNKKDNTRTFVLEDKANPQHIVGFLYSDHDSDRYAKPSGIAAEKTSVFNIRWADRTTSSG